MNKRIIWWLGLALLMLIGGMIGSWFYAYLIDRYNSSSALVKDATTSAVPLTSREARRVVVEQDQQAAAVVENLNKSLVGLFKKERADFRYNLTAREAEGLVITNDGWLVTNWRAGERAPATVVAITSDKKIYEVDKIINDEPAQLTFVHLKSAQGLSVADFVASGDLASGQIVLGVSWFGPSEPAFLKTVTNGEASVVKSSDNPWQRLVLDKTPPLSRLAVADLGGRVVGLINKNNELISLDYFLNAINYLLSGKDLARTSLGVNYLDLTYFAQNPKTAGALIAKDKKGAAVAKGSAAEQAGLQEGDIILALDEQVLGRGLNLSQAVAGYQVGQKAIVRYLRAGSAKETTVVFTEAK